MPFVGDLHLVLVNETYDGRPLYRTEANFGYTTNAGYEVVVLAGFTTDLLSAPRLPFIFWALGDAAPKASVIHDWLYQVQNIARPEADGIFLEAMAEEGMWWWRRRLIWMGVRIGGGIRWEEAAMKRSIINRELL